MPATATARAIERATRPNAIVTASLLCAFSGLLLQFLIVNLRYGGNWTALFCAGGILARPVSSNENLYLFPDSKGYDGQMYRLVAHDPLMKSDAWRYTDLPRARYGRILLPAAAFLLAAGQQGSIDAAYVAANLLFLFLGAWWLGNYLDMLGLDARWAAWFLLIPAALISLERLTVDLAFTALCIGFALYLRRGQDAYAWAILALACLSRETGFMLAGAACLTLAIERRFTKAAVFAAAVLPAAAWVGYVYLKTPGYLAPASEQLIPFQGIVHAFLHPATYHFRAGVAFSLVWLDRLGLLAFLAAMFLGLWLLRRNGFRQMETAILTWSLVGLCLPQSFWADCFAGPRVFSPLFAYIALSGAEIRGRWTVAPLLMTIPRVLVQVAAPMLLALAGKL